MSKLFGVLAILLLCSLAFSAEHGNTSEQDVEGHGSGAALTFLWIAVILIAAKIAGFVERFGQPTVLGELVIGLILGNLVLFGITFFEPIKTDSIILFLSELGVVILLFQIGLESNIHEMKKVGVSAFLVALIGVIAPFVLGTYVVGPAVFPGLSDNAYLFLGAALTATSVGITARVFRDLGKLKTPEAQTILGAAVIDDVMGLIILAVVSAIVTTGAVGFADIGFIVLKAVLFLGGSIALGQYFAPFFNKAFSQIHAGIPMKFTVAIAFCLIFAYLAQMIGLAPIVGAFAIGLILDPVHFKFFKNPAFVDDVKGAIKSASQSTREKISRVLEKHSEKHIEDLIEPVSYFLVPVFFVVTGMSVELQTLFDTQILMLALAITAVAFIGKVVAGIAASKGVDKLMVGVGMVPRGEVGLIFAMIGKNLGVINSQLFSIIVVMVILTTLLSPPLLAFLLRKKN